MDRCLNIQQIRIAVILTCYNRRQKTIACLDAVLAQQGLEDATLELFITDDGSTDGTATALQARYAGATLLRGSGSLFWNGGMRLAWSMAMPGSHDYVLWLNDDTFLQPDALRRMLDTHADARRSGARPGIVVGSTHGEHGETSYGGEWQRSALQPLTLDRITPQARMQPCDTFNGNCVLIDRAAVAILGNLDGGFIHAMGDTDYGLRAKKAAVPMWVMPGYAGRCVDDTPVRGGFKDRSLPLAQRVRQILAPKGLPWKPWLLLCRRHTGWFWPLYWSWPYLKLVATSVGPGPRKPSERIVP
jgi:GT2 family glycosyltransferase